MDEEIRKGVAKGLLMSAIQQNKPYWKKEITAIIIVSLIVIMIFTNFKYTGKVISEFDYGELEDTTAYDFWTLGNSSGTLQIDYVFVEPTQKYINETYYCFNGSVTNDVSSLLYLWYINGSLKTDLNTSTVVSGLRNFTTHDYLECGIIPQDSSLVAYWPLDEGSGVAFKEVVNNNSGASTTADWKKGRNHNSVNISLNNHYDVTTPTGLNLTNNFTYEIWMYPRSISTAGIIDNSNTVYIRSANQKIEGYLKISESSPTLKIVSPDSISLNQWNQIVLTYDNQNISLYLNGQLQNKTNLTGNMDVFSGNIALGRLIDAPSQYLEGQIDEVAIYNKSLSEAEIESHYNRGIVILSKDNTLILDVTEPNFLNGTLTNVTYSSSAGGLILSNCSTNNYCTQGIYTSSIKTINDNDYDAELFYGIKPISNGNISFEVRTGIKGDNGSINWGDYSGGDYSSNEDPSKILALSFSEGKSNTTQNSVTQEKYNLRYTDFSPKGKSGTALKFFETGGIVINDYQNLRLNYYNYSIEFYFLPHNAKNMEVFNKLVYSLNTNASLNLIYNTTCDGGLNYSIISNETLNLDKWNYVVITHSSENLTKIYLDGKLVANENSNSIITSSSSIFVLGYGGTSSTFNGSIDSFVVYNRTLSSDEVLNRNNSLNPQGGYFDSNDYIQYRATFSTTDTTQTPTLTNASIRLQNHTVFVYHSTPYNSVLSYFTNNSNISSELNSSIFNWSVGSILEAGDSLYYEWALYNYSNFSKFVDSNLGINNYSRPDYTDPQTLLVEHFDFKEELYNHGWLIKGSETSTLGRYNNGLRLDQSGGYLENSLRTIHSNEGSIEFWVMPYWSPSDGQTNYFFDHETGGLSLNRTGSQLLYSVGTENRSFITYNISNWNTNEWHHIAVNWERYGNITLILDGTQVNTTQIERISSFNDQAFYLGSNADITTSNIILNGVLDELRISRILRKDYSSLSVQAFNLSLSNISDGTYYWKVNNFVSGNFSLDNEILNSTTETWQINFNRRMPMIYFTEDYMNNYSDATKTIAFSSSENVFCQYRTLNSNWGNINNTGKTEHSLAIDINNYGNFTYYLNCNDSGNNYINKTFSYYVFEFTDGIYNFTEYNFTANTRTIINLTESGGNLSFFEITTKNDITSKLGVIKHFSDRNPENSSSGLGVEKVAFWTIVLDDNLVSNLTGNVTVRLVTTANDLATRFITNATLYWFNPQTSIWEDQGIDVDLVANTEVTINTSRFGTYTLSGSLPATPLTPRSTTPEEGALTPVIIQPECYSDTDCYEGYTCQNYYCAQGEYNSEEMGESGQYNVGAQTDLIQEIGDLTGILRSADLIGGGNFLLMLAYVFIIGGAVFYGYRIGLALILKMQMKGKIKIEDIEKNIDEGIKYYTYHHINNLNLKDELLKEGYSESQTESLLLKVNKLGRGKFEDYIYKSLAKGDSEQEIIKKLTEKGWDEIKIKKEIENFKNI